MALTSEVLLRKMLDLFGARKTSLLTGVTLPETMAVLAALNKLTAKLDSMEAKFDKLSGDLGAVQTNLDLLVTSIGIVQQGQAQIAELLKSGAAESATPAADGVMGAALLGWAPNTSAGASPSVFDDITSSDDLTTTSCIGDFHPNTTMVDLDAAHSQAALFPPSSTTTIADASVLFPGCAAAPLSTPDIEHSGVNIAAPANCSLKCTSSAIDVTVPTAVYEDPEYTEEALVTGQDFAIGADVTPPATTVDTLFTCSPKCQHTPLQEFKGLQDETGLTSICRVFNNFFSSFGDSGELLLADFGLIILVPGIIISAAVEIGRLESKYWDPGLAAGSWFMEHCRSRSDFHWDPGSLEILQSIQLNGYHANFAPAQLHIAWLHNSILLTAKCLGWRCLREDIAGRMLASGDYGIAMLHVSVALFLEFSGYCAANREFGLQFSLLVEKTQMGNFYGHVSIYIGAWIYWPLNFIGLVLVSDHLLSKVALSILSQEPCIVLCYVAVFVLGEKTHQSEVELFGLAGQSGVSLSLEDISKGIVLFGGHCSYSLDVNSALRCLFMPGQWCWSWSAAAMRDTNSPTSLSLRNTVQGHHLFILLISCSYYTVSAFTVPDKLFGLLPWSTSLFLPLADGAEWLRLITMQWSDNGFAIPIERNTKGLIVIFRYSVYLSYFLEVLGKHCVNLSSTAGTVGQAVLQGVWLQPVDEELILFCC